MTLICSQPIVVEKQNTNTETNTRDDYKYDEKDE